MTKERGRTVTGTSIRNTGRIPNIRDRREKDAAATSARRALSRKVAEAQRMALVVWDEV